MTKNDELNRVLVLSRRQPISPDFGFAQLAGAPGKRSKSQPQLSRGIGQIVDWISRRPRWLNMALGSFSWLLTTALIAMPAMAAERILLSYGPLQVSLAIDDLEIYAREGRVTDDFAFYARRVSPQQLAALRSLLQGRLEVGSTTVAQFTYSQIGETVIERLGQVVQTESGQDGFYALRAALILAAADSRGLTGLNLLRHFPIQSIRIDLTRGLKIRQAIAQRLQTSEAMIAGIQQRAAAESAIGATVDFSNQPDLQRPGPLMWEKVTFMLNDHRRQRVLPTDVYLPQAKQAADRKAVPVIVISHGAASERNTFDYLAQHLASYGFAVAVPEHADNAQRFRQFYAGLADPPEPTELIHRPLDVTYLLDELQRLEQTDPAWQGRLNLQQVGVIGQSLGGYTGLALAGAELNFEQLRRDCQGSKPQDAFFLNLSLLVQCGANELPPSTDGLQDKRIKAVIAINPLTSRILGRRSLSQIKVPLMLVAGSADVFTPAVPEQIIPFTWLTTSSKYLVLVNNGTHFSMLSQAALGGGGLPRLPPQLMGSEPALGRRYLKALSVAFAQRHVANRSEYQPYLKAAYAKAISQAPLELSFVQLLTGTQLTRFSLANQ